MRAAREMAAAGVDIVVLGGVPINLSRGYDNAQAMIRALEAELGVKVSTSLSAQEKAARTLGCRKVVIAQPYDASQNARQSGYAERFGCEVLGAAGWGSTIPRFGQIPAHVGLTMGRADPAISAGRFDPVPVAALADACGDRRDRARVRRQRDDRAAGGGVGRAAAGRR